MASNAPVYPPPTMPVCKMDCNAAHCPLSSCPLQWLLLDRKLQHFTASLLQKHISGLDFKWSTWPVCPFRYRIELWLMLLLLSCCKCPPLSVQSLFTGLIFSSHPLCCHHYFMLDWLSSSDYLICIPSCSCTIISVSFLFMWVKSLSFPFFLCYCQKHW